jgi:hypothetical protein
MLFRPSARRHAEWEQEGANFRSMMRGVIPAAS